MNIKIYIQSTLGSRNTDKLDFSISRTHLVGLVGFVSSSMLNFADKSDKFDKSDFSISRTHIIVIFMILYWINRNFYKLSEIVTLNNVYIIILVSNIIEYSMLCY